MIDLRFKIKDLRMLSRALFVLILLTFNFQLSTSPVSAQTATPSSTKAPATNAIDEKINDLKDRIASRVAQLKLVERRGIVGTVTEVSQTQITVNDIKNNTRFIDVDELTKFSSPSAKESFGISDIAKGTKIGVLGLYNKQSRRILSRFVDVVNFPKTLHGEISSLDEDEFVISVTTENNDTIFVDVETISKTTSYDNEGNAIRSGFSKLKIGNRIMVVGFPPKNDPDRIIASRILVFPNVTRNPKIKSSLPTPTLSVATESAKKASPSAR